MTSEAQDLPEEAPAPPASTRWSETEPGDEPDLMPPFVPGRTEASPPRAAPPQESPPPFDALGEEPFAPPFEPGAAAAEEDDFPFDAFDLEGPAPVSVPIPPAAREPAPATAGPGVPRQESPGRTAPAAGTVPRVSREAELADRLERLAGLLRTEGTSAIETEMAAGDRFGSLLAAVLAGYLAARP